MDVLIFDEQLSLGQKLRLLRMSKGLRQADVCARATDWLQSQPIPYALFKVGVHDVFKVESDRKVHWAKLKGICVVLGIDWDPNDG